MECEICTTAQGFVKTFSSKSNLVRHVAKAHPDVVPEKSSFACLLTDCGCNFKKIRPLRTHLKELHDLKEFGESSVSFETFGNFLGWKAKIEEATFSQFQKRGKPWKGKKCATTDIYYCHRATRGPAVESKWILPRQGVHGRTAQEGPYSDCRSVLTAVVQRQHDILVTYCLAHHGHEPEEEVHLLKINKRDRDEIATRTAMKISKRHILTELRREAWQSFEADGVYRRLMYVTMADLQNIERDHSLTGNTVDEDEFVSIQAEYERQKGGPDKDRYLVYVKNIGEECVHVPKMERDYFVAVIQTEFQRQMPQRIDTKTLCMDSTHGTLHDPDYKLVTLMGLDGLERGIPLAHFIVNHDDTKASPAAFHALKGQLEHKEVNYLLSDDVPVYHNAWKKTFPQKLTRHILCIWHVSKNVNQKIDRCVKNTLTAFEIKKAVRDIMYCPDHPSFKRAMKRLSELCAGYKDLREYLENYYLNRMDMWMLRSRQGSTMTTSGYVENFHRVFKLFHLRERGANRVDQLAELLMDYAEFVKYELEGQKRRPTKSFRERQLSLQHETAMEDSRLFILQSDNEFRWACSKRHDVTAAETLEDITAGECYVIRLVQCPQKNCELRCNGCKPFCAHQLVCACPSAMGTKTYCKHAHLMGSFLHNVPAIHRYSTTATAPASQAAISVQVMAQTPFQASEEDMLRDNVGSTSATEEWRADPEPIPQRRDLALHFQKHCTNIQVFVDKARKENSGPSLKRLQKVSNMVSALDIGTKISKPAFSQPRKLRPGHSRMKRQSRRHKKHRPQRKSQKSRAPRASRATS